MSQSDQTNLPVVVVPDASAPLSDRFYSVTLDQAERETLEILLKEIILNLPLDKESDEELYRSDIQGEREQFKLNLYGYEMRALRTLLQKVR
ncbi:MAG: hypothetical protein GY754_04495 [bacterium]|nr:hypothetical protein [bacterium]